MYGRSGKSVRLSKIKLLKDIIMLAEVASLKVER
jgi:hypothetical protein